MIKYKLKCKDCLKLFDSWFLSSKEFDKLKKSNFINCPSCNSLKIDKSLKDLQKSYLDLYDSLRKKGLEDGVEFWFNQSFQMWITEKDA